MCPRSNSPLLLLVLVVILGHDPNVIKLGDIIVFRPNPNNPNYLIVHRIIMVYTPSNDTVYPGQYAFVTHGDANPPGSNEGPNPGSALVGIYQFTIPIPYLGSAILDIRNFMYDDNTGQPKTQGILVIVALIVALFALEFAESGKKKLYSNLPEETKSSVASTRILHPDATSKLDSAILFRFFSLRPG